MKLIVDGDGFIIGRVSDIYSGPATVVDVSDDFDLSRASEYVLFSGSLTSDPQAVLLTVKRRAINKIRTHFDNTMHGIKASVASYEVLTWDTQRNELAMYLASPANPTPYVDSLAAARGETRDVLFTKIKAKVDAMAALQGTQHLLEKQVEAASTLAEVEAVILP